MDVVWTDRAFYRLQGILEYIAKDQPVNAEQWVDQLLERGDSVRDQPFMGRIVPEYQDETIREVLQNDYRIIYKIRLKRVDILTVRHGSQLLPTEANKL
ncbi:type II toxin-antitoxin system RelE/ParE family toxin [Gammaproteobacteria bacterium AH-315-E17]|nr:type II toxin-antitoxin system RelE/ParE family toxin [Gammaproteobacteria bacterium AH-315-E17]